MQIVIVSTRTGTVTMPPNLQSLWLGHVHDEMFEQPQNLAHPALRFTQTGRLLVALGAPNEGDRDGIHFFEWTDRALPEFQFAPRQQVCEPSRAN